MTENESTIEDLIKHIKSDKTKDDLLDRSLAKTMDFEKTKKFNTNPKNYATILLYDVLEKMDKLEKQMDKITHLSEGYIEFKAPEHVIGDIYQCTREDMICLDCNKKQCKQCNYTGCINCGSDNLWIKHEPFEISIPRDHSIITKSNLKYEDDKK